MATRIDLKQGSLGDIYGEPAGQPVRIVRELRTTRWRRLARHLARRESAALLKLAGLEGIPRLTALDANRLVRSFLPGVAMHQGDGPSRRYFRDALRLLRQMHRLQVTHNDLAKEANRICMDDDRAGIVDFQLAVCFRRRGRWFRLLAREDLRHLLKHKRHYWPQSLTARERQILNTPMWPARWWRRLIKPVYLFLTRRILGWPERNSAAERQRTIR